MKANKSVNGRSGGRSSKTASQLVEEANLTINEKILRQCHSLYTDPKNGLIKIAEAVGISLLPPRKKIIILLIGNHSAGKSTFVNWYIEEHVQRTGVAIETQGFTLITSGKKRETLTGNATLHLYPHLEKLRTISGVPDYLATEISTSKAKKFNLVTFIDTPGLVDGDMIYPFDVNKAITWLGDLADRIFIFFDPIGQALCKRTLNLVEKLHERHADRMRFYLSKADEAGPETDRQRVMMQIVQELCKRKGLNRTCFDMPTIYVPTMAAKQTRCVNQIEDVCIEIEKTINQTIQNTLNALERDCDNIASRVDTMVEEHTAAASINMWRALRRYTCASFATLLPLWVAIAAVVAMFTPQKLEPLVGKYTASLLSSSSDPAFFLYHIIPAGYGLYALVAFVFLCFFAFIYGRYYNKPLPTLSRKDRQQLATYREYVQNVVKPQKQQLYSDYLHQSHDLENH